MNKVNQDRERLDRVRKLARWLDSKFQIGGISVGWDPIIGLVPGVGDGVASVLSTYILYEALQAGVSSMVVARMAGNILIENVIGVVPVVGDLFDVIWKANQKNARLLEQAVSDPRATQRRSTLLVFAFVTVFFLLCLGLISLPIVLLVLIL